MVNNIAITVTILILILYINYSIIKQVAQGLEYLHENELVHRDIKSANMLLDFDTGIIRLADFGVSNHLLTNLNDLPKNTSYLRQKKKEDFLSVQQPKKARRSFVGTPCWMAPEILLNQDYDTQVDMWSLGITCLELACGKPPFAEYDPMTIFSMIIDDPVPTLYTNGIRYAPSSFIQDFIERCLDKNPRTRLSVTEALNHPFLKRASSHQLLQKYLARKPELNKKDYLMSRPVVQQHYEEDDFEQEEQDSWDELDFINSTWNFNNETNKRPHVRTTYLGSSNYSEASSSPITPNDEQQDIIFNTRIVDYKTKSKQEDEYLMTKEYYY